MIKKILSAILLAICFGCYMKIAAQTLPSMKADGTELQVIADGKLVIGRWSVNPALRPDIFETSASKVTFRSGIDSITFNLERGGTYDFVVITPEADSAFTHIRWVSANPLEEPSPEMLKLPASGLLTKQQASFDIDALVYTISQVHPDMFATCNQGKFLAEVARIKQQLPDSASKVDLYRLAAPLVAELGDGHTSLYFPLNDVFHRDTPRMPLSVKASPDFKIKANWCIDSIIPQGAEIISINGHSCKEMLEEMMKYVSGERDFYRLERACNDFTAFFQLLYAAPDYEVAYRPVGSKKVLTAKFQPISYDELKKQRPSKQTAPQKPAYSFYILKKEKTAVMDFRSFNDARRMKVFADSMFRTLRKENIANLIIDVRNNGGGNSTVGDTLLRYISPYPFEQMGKALVRVTPTTQRLLGNKNIQPGWYLFNPEAEGELISPLSSEQGHYQGKVYLLTSHHTFSSASSFAWAFKQFGMGTVVGEESGGMNVSFGDILFYHLPVSRLACSISYKRFWQYGADEADIHGTLPDCSVPEEKALDTALKLIRKAR